MIDSSSKRRQKSPAVVGSGSVAVEVDRRSVPGLRLVEAWTLSNPDHTWTASADDDTSVLPRPNGTAAVADGRLSLRVPPASWSLVRLGV